MRKKNSHHVLNSKNNGNELFTPYFENNRNPKPYKRMVWDEEEKLKYINFLSKNKRHFVSERDRR